jgi:hypothetical protein
MITLQVTVDVKDDRRVVLTLPPEVPVGPAEMVVTISQQAGTKKPARTSLAEWAETNGEHLGDRISSEDVEGFTGRREDFEKYLAAVPDVEPAENDRLE